MLMTETRKEVMSLINAASVAKKDFAGSLEDLRIRFTAWNNEYFRYTDELLKRLDKFKSVPSPAAMCWCFKKYDYDLLVTGLRYCNSLILKLRSGAPISMKMLESSIFTNCGIRLVNVYDTETIEFNDEYVRLPQYGRWLPLAAAPADAVAEMLRFPMFTHPESAVYSEEQLATYHAQQLGSPDRKPITPIVVSRITSENPTLDLHTTYLNSSGAACTGTLSIDITGSYEETSLGLEVKKQELRKITGAPSNTYYFDPSFDWQVYEDELRSGGEPYFTKELSCSRLWRGWFGTNALQCPNDLVDAMLLRPLCKLGWDGRVYKAAFNLIGDVRQLDFETKMDIEWLLSLYTEPSQAAALWQLGNVWAVRHELIRILAAQIARISKASDVDP